MEKEFQESDLSQTNNTKKTQNTLPITISRNSSTRSLPKDSDSDENDDLDHDLDKEFVPPHLIVSQRIARTMAFSVCTGNGRTLKGRDLSQVRNSVLRMTGFLET